MCALADAHVVKWLEPPHHSVALACELAPGKPWCGDEAAREVTEARTRDARYEPICAGPLANAAMQEEVLGLIFAIAKEGGTGEFFYRMAAPERL